MPAGEHVGSAVGGKQEGGTRVTRAVGSDGRCRDGRQMQKVPIPQVTASPRFDVDRISRGDCDQGGDGRGDLQGGWCRAIKGYKTPGHDANRGHEQAKRRHWREGGLGEMQHSSACPSRALHVRNRGRPSESVCGHGEGGQAARVCVPIAVVGAAGCATAWVQCAGRGPFCRRIGCAPSRGRSPSSSISARRGGSTSLTTAPPPAILYPHIHCSAALFFSAHSSLPVACNCLQAVAHSSVILIPPHSPCRLVRHSTHRRCSSRPTHSLRVLLGLFRNAAASGSSLSSASVRHRRPHTRRSLQMSTSTFYQ